MQVETVSTSSEPIIASNPQDTQKNGWTCVNWYNTVFEIVARKTSRIFGHMVAGFVSVFTFIPSLTADLKHAVFNLYDRKISRPETPIQIQVSAAVLPASVSSDISAHSLPSSLGLIPARKRVPLCDLSTSGLHHNVSNANVRPPGRSSEGAQEASACPTGSVSPVIKSPGAGFGSTGSAGDTASELSQGRNIHQREVSAAKPQTSEQKIRDVYISTDIHPSFSQTREKTVQGVSVATQTSPLLTLPDELLLKISTYLSFDECTHLSMTSIQLRRVFSIEERLKSLFDRYYGPPSVTGIYRKNIANREIPPVPGHDISEPLYRLAYHRYQSNKFLESLGNNTSQACVETANKLTVDVCSAAPLPGGLIACSCRDKTIKVWDLSKLQEQPLTEIENTGWQYGVIALSNGGLASIFDDIGIKVWNLSNPRGQRCEAILYGHTSPIQCITQLPDGRLVTGSGDRTVKVWDLSRPVGEQCVATLRGHTDMVTSVMAMPDGRLLSCSHSHVVKIWNLSKPDGQQCEATFEEDDIMASWEDAVTLLANGWLVSRSHNQTIKVWDLNMPEGERCVATLRGHTKLVHTVIVLFDGRLVTCSDDKTIKVWDLSKPGKGQCVATLRGHNCAVRLVVQLEDGRLISLDNNNNVIKLWDLTWRTIQGHGHRDEVLSVTKMNDKYMASCFPPPAENSHLCMLM